MANKVTLWEVIDVEPMFMLGGGMSTTLAPEPKSTRWVNLGYCLYLKPKSTCPAPILRQPSGATSSRNVDLDYR